MECAATVPRTSQERFEMTIRVRNDYKPAKVLATWRTLAQALPDMNEKELLASLEAEAKRPCDERRRDIIHRLHRRYTKLRQERELQEYLQ
jgi:hypothetical protein